MTHHDQTQSRERIVVYIDEGLECLMEGFFENRWSDIEKIYEALASGDYETARVLGHSMKGSGGGYGFDAITDMGSAIEIAAKNQDEPEVRKQLTELSTYLELVEVLYE